MKRARRARLEEAGWRVGNATSFLGLSEAEEKLVEARLALSDALRLSRVRKRLTQAELAKRLGSSQSRVAKLESGAEGVTLDLLFRALFVAGVSTAEIARCLTAKKRPAA